METSCSGTIEGTQGDVLEFDLYLKEDECEAEKAIDLTGCTVFEVAFPPLVSGAPIIMDLSSGLTLQEVKSGWVHGKMPSTVCNTVKTSLIDSKTKALIGQDIEIHYLIPGTTEKYETLSAVLFLAARKLFP
jgi:hypothetical protein